MRTIKFRCYDNDNRKMNYDVTGLEFVKGKLTGALIGGDFVKSCYILQFTGLYDKNGKEIYEGDILKYCCYDNDYKIYVVKQKIDGWELRSTRKPKSVKSFYYADRLEIIGNIYDNKDLLEGGINEK